MLRDRLHIHIVRRLAFEEPAAHGDGALAQRLVLVRADERLVDDLLEAQPAAVGAGSVRRIEGEQPRLDLLYADAAVGAGIFDGKELFLAAAVDDDQPVGKSERRFEAVRKALPDAVFDDEAVDDDADAVLDVLVEFYVFL